MAAVLNPRATAIAVFIAILLQNFGGSQSETTVSVKLVTFENYKPCEKTCDFSFFICLDKSKLSDHALCAYNQSFMGPFYNQSRVTFTLSPKNPVVASVPDSENKIYLNVSVFERGGHSDRGGNSWWDALTTQFTIKPANTQKQSVSITGHENQTRLTVEFSTCCTPGGKEILAKVCEERDDQFGHFTCTASGDKKCRKGWNDVATNCTTPQKSVCKCKNGGTCSKGGQCACTLGYTGKQCQFPMPMTTVAVNQKKSTQGQSPRGIASAVGIIIGFALLMTLVSVSTVLLLNKLICKKKKKRRSLYALYYERGLL